MSKFIDFELGERELKTFSEKQIQERIKRVAAIKRRLKKKKEK